MLSRLQLLNRKSFMNTKSEKLQLEHCGTEKGNHQGENHLQRRLQGLVHYINNIL
jgi:hypothetical protein